MYVHDVVVDVVELAFVEQVAHEPLDGLAGGELQRQVVDHLALLVGQLAGIVGVDSGEVRVGEPFGVSLRKHLAQAIEVQARLHAQLRVLLDGLFFELELDYGQGLLHFFGDVKLGLEAARDLAGIEFQGELREPCQVDVEAAQKFKVVVAGADAQRLGDERLVACGRSHPQDVVIAPDIGHVGADVVLHEYSEYLVGFVAAVEDVAQHDEPAQDDLFDHLGQGRDHPVGDTVVFKDDVGHGKVEDEVLDDQPQVFVDVAPDAVEVHDVLDLVADDLHQGGNDVLALHGVIVGGDVFFFPDCAVQVVELFPGYGFGKRLKGGLPHQAETSLEDRNETFARAVGIAYPQGGVDVAAQLGFDPGQLLNDAVVFDQVHCLHRFPHARGADRARARAVSVPARMQPCSAVS